MTPAAGGASSSQTYAAWTLAMTYAAAAAAAAVPTWCEASLGNSLHVERRQGIRVATQKLKPSITTLGLER
jgi:hypothetical protein